MTKFRVIGCSRDDGSDVAMDVEAATSAQAESKANAMGIVVERVEIANTPAPPARPIQAAPQQVIVERIVQAPVPPPPQYQQQIPTITIQKTSKKYKAMCALGLFVAMVGVAVAFLHLKNPDTISAGTAFGFGVAAMFGLGVWMAGRVLAWWHHA